ncbi:MAG TPA: helix-turn-helix transcriptional regulator [Acidimicrobiales bacterium]|nr:helix-turn-helix transcriptional regulator [Acidimicrobiales bacterium]
MSATSVGGDEHRIACHLDRLLVQRGMTLTELAHRVGVTVVNLSVLKNDRAKAVRFSTLTRICDALDCQPGDLFSLAPSAASAPRRPAIGRTRSSRS